MHRVSLDLDERIVEIIDEIKEELGLAIRKQVFQYALSILFWMREKIKEDKEILVLSKEEAKAINAKTVLLIPGFELLKRRGQNEKKSQC